MNRKRKKSENLFVDSFFKLSGTALLLTALLFTSGSLSVNGMPDQAGGAAEFAAESSEAAAETGAVFAFPGISKASKGIESTLAAPDAGGIPEEVGAAAAAAEASGAAENIRPAEMSAGFIGDAENVGESADIMGITGNTGLGKTASAQSALLFDEPYFSENAPNGKPMFRLSWDSYPEADSYEIAFYAEGEDSYGRGPFAIRSTKNTYEGRTETPVVFLQGVYTDTVTYRMKVRPRIGVDAWTDPEDYIWSNIWEIRFVDGEYTVSETDADFDAEIAAAEAEKKAAETPTPTPTPTPAPEKKEPLPHELPEPFLTFLARESGEETPYDTDEVARLSVMVFQGEAGGSSQNVGNAEVVKKFCEAVRNITVTERKPRQEEEIIMLDADYGTGYTALNADNERLFSFYLDGITADWGDWTYRLEGTEALDDIQGIMTTENMYDFRDGYDEGQREYEDRLKNPIGLSLLDASYSTYLMAKEEDEAVFHIGAYMDWNKDAGRLNTADSDEIGAILKAMSETTIGEKVSNSEGEMWHMTFSWWPSEPIYGGEAWLGLNGDCVKIGDQYYRVEGIEKLYEAVDSPFFNYMRNYSTAPTLKPSY